MGEAGTNTQVSNSIAEWLWGGDAMFSCGRGLRLLASVKDAAKRNTGHKL